MKIFLAATGVMKDNPEVLSKCDYILESYYVLQKKDLPEYIQNCEMLLLDSGAFTFMNSSKKTVDWEKYISEYIKFINKYDIQFFFELDIDPIIGYEKVKILRKKLEEGTGKKCIPVWHKSRGKEEFLKMCNEYDYVAIGGIVTKEISRRDYKYLSWFIKEAHKRNTKIHGLGFTNMNGLKRYHFDSVDSTSWLNGCRFGMAYKFDGKQLITRQKQQDYRMKDPKLVNINNFTEWCKFQQYAKMYL